MATTKRKGIDSKYGDPVERAIATIVYDNEYKQAKSNNDVDYAEYENLLDLLDGIRAEKNYSWNSDIHIPLFFAHLASEASTWAAQYFSSRDFCDVYLEGLDPKDKLKSYATKVLINKTLNMKDIYHYHKYIRGRMINWLFGQKYTICYWDFKSKMVKVKQPPEQRQVPEIDEQTGDIVYRPSPTPWQWPGRPDWQPASAAGYPAVTESRVTVIQVARKLRQLPRRRRARHSDTGTARHGDS